MQNETPTLQPTMPQLHMEINHFVYMRNGRVDVLRNILYRIERKYGLSLVRD